MDTIGIVQAFADTLEPIYSILHQIVTKNTSYVSIGNLFMLNNRPYVLTCNHCVKNTITQNFIINGKNFICTVKFLAPELELALLEIHNLDIQCNFLTINDLATKIMTYADEIVIKSLNVDDFINHRTPNKITLNCTNYRMVNKRMESLNIPELPIIILQTNLQPNIDMHGISGSLVYYSNKILGIVSNINNSEINVVSSRNIYRFLTEILETNKYCGICTIIGNMKSVTFKTDENVTVNGLQIKDNLNINYNNYVYDKPNTKSKNLKDNDIIYSINNKLFDEHINVYDDELEMNVPYKTYIALNYICGDEIPLTLMRITNIKTDDYETKKLFIRARPLESFKYIPLTFNKELFTYHGFTFGEISEDILNEYTKSGVHLGTSLIDHYIHTPYRNDAVHVVVLLNINKNEFDTNLLKQINLFGLPLVRINEKDYSIPIVKKINNKNITSLNKMKTMLNEHQKNTIHLTIAKKDHIKLIFDNNKILIYTRSGIEL